MQLIDASGVFWTQCSPDPALIAGGLSIQWIVRAQQTPLPALRPQIYLDAGQVVTVVARNIVRAAIRIISFVQFVHRPKAGVIADAIAVVPQGPPLMKVA